MRRHADEFMVHRSRSSRSARGRFASFLTGCLVGCVLCYYFLPFRSGSRFATYAMRQNASPEIVRLEKKLETHQHRRATEDKLSIRITGAAEAFSDGTPYWTLKGDPLTAQQVLDALPNILHELDRYPVKLVSATPLKRIVLCGTLSRDGVVCGGLADTVSGTIYMSIPAWNSADPSLIHDIHHEMYHMIDSVNFAIGTEDPEWSGLNPSAFAYGKGGITAMTGEVSSTELTGQWRGFVTAYSRSAVEEDKAETFASMMTRLSEMKKKMQTDPIVAAKVNIIRMRCAKICPEFKP